MKHKILVLALTLASASAFAEKLTVTKIWHWKNEVQVQLETADGLSGYLFNVQRKDDRYLGAKMHAYGHPARPLVDYCLMKEMIVGALEGAPPALIMNGKRDETFPDPINFRERLSQYDRPQGEVYWQRTRELLKELFRPQRACSPIPAE